MTHLDSCRIISQPGGPSIVTRFEPRLISSQNEGARRYDLIPATLICSSEQWGRRCDFESRRVAPR